MPYVEPNPMLECIYQNESFAVDASCWIMPNNHSLEGVCGVAKDTTLMWNNTNVDINVCRRIGPPPEEKRETIGAVVRSPEMLKLLGINGFVQ
ncbi:hypothetical protein ANCDUO_15806 [Ancylostoma duodenale]|uniref:Uncharacterized protein n=1 Tax=Ancylostoma duodenale TaxID=51022 RepID=A0A0C2CCJ2_9BILA|nr:hypothetical protein ANCDUO_15806 [Ancylostoma duodenale]